MDGRPRISGAKFCTAYVRKFWTAAAFEQGQRAHDSAIPSRLGTYVLETINRPRSCPCPWHRTVCASNLFLGKGIERGSESCLISSKGHWRTLDNTTLFDLWIRWTLQDQVDHVPSFAAESSDGPRPSLILCWGRKRSPCRCSLHAWHIQKRMARNEETCEADGFSLSTQLERLWSFKQCWKRCWHHHVAKGGANVKKLSLQKAFPGL